jgi:hypothetical protein
MTLLRSLLVAVATVAVTSCSSGPTLPDNGEELAGTLIDFLPGPQYLGAPMTMLVEGDTPAPEARRIVHVETGTRVYRVSRLGRLVPVDREELAVGDLLQVWATGAELPVYPAQVTATRVYIIR